MRPGKAAILGCAIALITAAPAFARTLAPGAPLFDYTAVTPTVQEIGVVHHPGVDVHDITFSVPGSDPVSAYLVTPDGPGPYAGIEFAHWLSGRPTGNRGEFLREAIALAHKGAVSLLPQQVFPFFADPDGTQFDYDRIVQSVIVLRRGLDLLQAQPGVDPARLAMVGHDYGAMYTSLAAAVDPRVSAVALMTPDSTFSNWFQKYWLGLDPGPLATYQALLAPLDPIAYVGYEPPALYQFSGHDQYVPTAVRNAILSAASKPERDQVFANAGHMLNHAAQRPRDIWLAQQLTLR